ncbi:secretion protein [Noviherbaspirillum aridicola]|uniref:Secretion protein n=2 Tax=Noviherbaspirillum aridicola TaxID=2849687 RepID=A0ABQ4Q9B0_9BURK|nr:secretion protein [Noviherbaspirillum aridicola]
MGDIILVRPLSFAFLSGAAVLAAVVVVLFLAFGSYTRRATVSGQLLPATGLLKVHTPQAGIVIGKHVAEGQPVSRGDILYTISGERHSGSLGSTQDLVAAQLAARRRSLRDEADKHRLLYREEKIALGKRMDSLQREADRLAAQKEDQKSRLRIAEETHHRYRDLLAQAYVSRESVQQKQADVLDQRARLQNLERESLAIERELAARRHELGSLAPRLENQLAQIDRAVAGIEQEMTENDARRRIVIQAPEAGIATAAQAEPGQAVDAARPLVSIVPRHARLQAQLHARSRAVGFIRPGDRVLLRYTAYPYQKFGHADGVVAAVARTALPGDELNNDAPHEAAEPVYRITVSLASQTMMAYGRPQPLQSGMLVEADLLQETRRLYEWVLEPLYSMGRRL